MLASNAKDRNDRLYKCLQTIIDWHDVGRVRDVEIRKVLLNESLDNTLKVIIKFILDESSPNERHGEATVTGIPTKTLSYEDMISFADFANAIKNHKILCVSFDLSLSLPEEALSSTFS